MDDSKRTNGRQSLVLTDEETRQLRPTVNVKALQAFLSHLPDFEQNRQLILAAFYGSLYSDQRIAQFQGLSIISEESADHDTDGDEEVFIHRILIPEPSDPDLARLWKAIEPRE